jgi:hypothetical protein
MSSQSHSLMRFATTELAEKIEAWRRQQPRIPTMAAAMRVLVEQGLAAEQKAKEQST